MSLHHFIIDAALSKAMERSVYLETSLDLSNNWLFRQPCLKSLHKQMCGMVLFD